MKRSYLLAGTACLCLALIGCSDNNQPEGALPDGVATRAPGARPSLSRVGTTIPTNDFVITAPDDKTLPSNLEAAVAAAGGTIKHHFNEAGIAVATSTRPDFATKLSATRGIASVSRDAQIQWIAPDPGTPVIEVGQPAAPPAFSGTTETFSNLQWAPTAIEAPKAWARNHRGKGARVAVLDGGIHSTHIDLVANLDVAASRSMVEGFPFNSDVGTFWHGTHVAGIVAAAADGVGITGIAPEATIIGVKVLHNGTGSFDQVIAGIMYAATPLSRGGGGADIINMSLGALIDVNAEGARDLLRAMSRATLYAVSRGVVVIASAGNDAVDLDNAGSIVSVPAESKGVIAVSATAPIGWALDPATNLDVPTSYTNFGKTAIAIAGPGGDTMLPGEDICVVDRIPAGTGQVVQYCWVLDMVFSTVRGTSNGSYGWAAGTSMAAPAASGVAALIVGKYRRLGVIGVSLKLLASLDDLGPRGKDAYFGFGRVNAWRAVR